MKGKKPLENPIPSSKGIRKSSRLEKNEDVKVADKAIFRAEAKDAFLNKGMYKNSFSLLDSNNEDLIDISTRLGVSLGPSESVAMANLDLIKDLELSRKLLAIQSCKKIQRMRFPSLTTIMMWIVVSMLILIKTMIMTFWMSWF
jgi:hypothetical protein